MNTQASHSPTKSTSTTPTAAMIVIGNEILCGRTQEKNMHWISGELFKRGIRLCEARIVEDVHEDIVAAVRATKAKYDFVFTSGGIGPTHDDITAEAIADALDLPYEMHTEAKKILCNYYKPEDQTPERMKMAMMPKEAILIPNAISAAPGFIVENVHVMAGVPSIFKSMFQAIAHELHGGPPIVSESVMVHCPESVIAAPLAAIQKNHPEMDIGSYPFVKQGEFGTRIVFTGTDTAALSQASQELQSLLTEQEIAFE